MQLLQPECCCICRWRHPVTCHGSPARSKWMAPSLNQPANTFPDWLPKLTDREIDVAFTGCGAHDALGRARRQGCLAFLCGQGCLTWHAFYTTAAHTQRGTLATPWHFAAGEVNAPHEQHHADMDRACAGRLNRGAG